MKYLAEHDLFFEPKIINVDFTKEKKLQGEVTEW